MALVVLAAGVFLRALGAAEICSRTEAVEALGVQEMVEHGRWLTPALGGRYPMFKPPLFHWTASALARLAGVQIASAWWVRLPSVVYAVATIAICMALAARRLGERAGILAGLLLLSSYQFVTQARVGRVDMTLAFFETASLFAFLGWLAATGGEARAGAERERIATRGWHYSLAGSLGLAVLAKGPIGALLPGFAIASLLVVESRSRDLRRLLAPGPVLLALLLGSSWYLVCLLGLDWTTLARQLGSENLDRFSGRLGEMPLHYYANPLLLGSLPASLLAPLAVARAFQLRWRRSTPRPEGRDSWPLLLAIFWVATVAFFTVASYKRRAYLLPLLPVNAVLLPWGLSTIASEETRRLVSGSVVGACLAMIAFGAIYVPWNERRACPPGPCREAAARVDREAPGRWSLPLCATGIEEVAPILFYLRRPVEIVSFRRADLPIVVGTGVPTTVRGCGVALLRDGERLPRGLAGASGRGGASTSPGLLPPAGRGSRLWPCA